MKVRAFASQKEYNTPLERYISDPRASNFSDARGRAAHTDRGVLICY